MNIKRSEYLKNGNDERLIKLALINNFLDGLSTVGDGLEKQYVESALAAKKEDYYSH